MNESLEKFLFAARLLMKPSVLELGTLQSVPGRSTMHKSWIPDASEWIGTDIEKGPDVDIVADVHRLSDFLNGKIFDIIISCSTFEHFKYPHLAAYEISKCLRNGGLVFIQTHHCFPLHAYPFDYFRFSTEALSACFGTRNGISVVHSCYEFPANIVSSENGNNADFLNTNLFAVKDHVTPEKYIYEFDTEI